MRACRSGWRSEVLQSSRLLLRALQPSDLNATYLGWLSDLKVNQHLETRFLPPSIESIIAYWESHRDGPSSPWFAICLIEDGRHIGNIKLGPIHWLYRSADISLFIGERSCWGNGYASEAIGLVRDWAFLELDLKKLNAGICAGNQGSRRAFDKCGFELEGTLRQEVVSAGQRQDVWRLGLPKSNWRTSQ